MQGNVLNIREMCKITGNDKNIVSEECRQVIQQCSIFGCSVQRLRLEFSRLIAEGKKLFLSLLVQQRKLL